MSEYTHTLIPERPEFIPNAKQVGTFLASLESMGAAPMTPAIAVSKLTGELRSVMNPITRQIESAPRRKAEKVVGLAAVPRALESLDDYTLTFAGKGPPRLPAFKFDFEGEYDFLIHCYLRANVVSTSDWHGETPVDPEVKLFGEPCSPSDRLGIFHHPNTLEVIRVPGAGCARFWIEFEFGKYLFPPIEDRLDLIEPAIVEAAHRAFDIKFVQGCHWCA